MGGNSKRDHLSDHYFYSDVHDVQNVWKGEVNKTCPGVHPLHSLVSDRLLYPLHRLCDFSRTGIPCAYSRSGGNGILYYHRKKRGSGSEKQVRIPESE